MYFLVVNDAETKDGDKGCDRAKLASECFIKHATEVMPMLFLTTQ